MCNTKLPLSLLLPLLLGIIVVCGASPGYDDNINYWEAFAPGKLLQRLDSLTSGSTANSTNADRKLDDEPENLSSDVSAAAEAADDNDEQVELEDQEQEADDADNYEHNYEQFVREYFDRVHDDDADDDVADASLHSGSVELDEPAPFASNVQAKSRSKAKPSSEQRCKRVQRKGQLCKICKNPRNNEVSETCSYSHEEQPEQYAYDTGSAYRRYREAEAEPRHDTAVGQRRAKAAADGTVTSSSRSLCVRRQRKQHVCYECEDSAGERLQRCYKLQGIDGPPEQSHKAEQRIYKRTISYSYSGRNNATGDAGGASTTASPPPLLRQPKQRRMLKVLHTRRRRGNTVF